jgi:tRNA nucleotidyltransferase (CCA-adding enzyme)
MPDGQSLDLISARSEIYSQPGALPTVKFSSIVDDLHRRDFTINAMAVRLDGDPLGALIDPLEGQADLQRGVIRVLHPKSFLDDPTRIFRAARYAVRYGFKLEDATLKLVNEEACQVLAGLSGERLRHEFDLTFAEQYAGVILARLREMKVLTAIAPALNTLTEPLPPLMEPAREWGGFPTPEMLTMRQCLGWLTWLMPLPKAELVALSERLAFPAALTRSALAASALLVDLPLLAGSKPSQWTFLLDALPALAVYAVYLRTQTITLKEYLAHWRHIHPHTTGEDLKVLGLPPGPRYKEIITHLRAAWLDGEVKSVEEEKKLLENFLAG